MFTDLFAYESLSPSRHGRNLVDIWNARHLHDRSYPVVDPVSRSRVRLTLLLSGSSCGGGVDVVHIVDLNLGVLNMFLF